MYVCTWLNPPPKYSVNLRILLFGHYKSRRATWVFRHPPQVTLLTHTHALSPFPHPPHPLRLPRPTCFAFLCLVLLHRAMNLFFRLPASQPAGLKRASLADRLPSLAKRWKGFIFGTPSPLPLLSLLPRSSLSVRLEVPYRLTPFYLFRQLLIAFDLFSPSPCLLSLCRRLAIYSLSPVPPNGWGFRSKSIPRHGGLAAWHNGTALNSTGAPLCRNIQIEPDYYP